MDQYTTTRDQWLIEYRKDKEAIWIIAVLSDGTEVYFKEYKTWMSLKDTCDSENLYIHSIRLQYRSHVVESDTEDAEAVYLVRSVKGQIGGRTSQYYTIGTLKDGMMCKTRWLIPELAEEEKFEETLDNCFEEAIIYNHARKPNG